MVNQDFEADVEAHEEEGRRSLLFHPASLFGIAIALFALGFLSFLAFADRFDLFPCQRSGADLQLFQFVLGDDIRGWLGLHGIE